MKIEKVLEIYTFPAFLIRVRMFNNLSKEAIGIDFRLISKAIVDSGRRPSRRDMNSERNPSQEIELN